MTAGRIAALAAAVQTHLAQAVAQTLHQAQLSALVVLHLLPMLIQ